MVMFKEILNFWEEKNICVCFEPFNHSRVMIEFDDSILFSDLVEFKKYFKEIQFDEIQCSHKTFFIDVWLINDVVFSDIENDFEYKREYCNRCEMECEYDYKGNCEDCGDNLI